MLALSAACGQPVPDEDRWTGALADDEQSVVGEVPAPGVIAEPGPVTEVTGVTAPPAPDAPETEQAETSSPSGPTQSFGSGGCDLALTELRMSTGSPSALASGDDGTVWFTDPHLGLIGRMAPDGSVRRFRLPAGSTPTDITRGPDGNYWFLDSKAPWAAAFDSKAAEPEPVVGRISPDGELAFFPLPTAGQNRMGGPGMGSLPVSIVTGPDGALWFTESGADKIGRITVDGAITEIDVPSRPVMHAHLGEIVVGPDGALWFQQALRNSLGRFDPQTQQFEEFQKRDRNGGLVGGSHLAVGTDGALWYEGSVHPAGPGLNRMTLDGQSRHFPLLTGRRHDPQAVAADPAGGIWFIDAAGGRPMHMTPDGAGAPSTKSPGRSRPAPPTSSSPPRAPSGTPSPNGTSSDASPAKRPHDPQLEDIQEGRPRSAR